MHGTINIKNHLTYRLFKFGFFILHQPLRLDICNLASVYEDALAYNLICMLN